MPSSDNSDTTPVEKHRSGEHAEYDLITWLRRIEKKMDNNRDEIVKKVDDLKGDLNKHIIDDTRVEMRLGAVEKENAERKSFGVGMKLAIVGAIMAPVISMLVILAKQL